MSSGRAAHSRFGRSGDASCRELLPPVIGKFKSPFRRFEQMKLARLLPMKDTEGLE
jgi:hypothetical protein